MSHYKHYTFSEQVDLLESRGMIVEDKEKTTNKLEFINYNKLKELAYPFSIKDGEDIIRKIGSHKHLISRIFYLKKEEYFMRENIELTKKRAYELFDDKIIDTFEVETFKGLQQIHHYMFQDVFDFAGKIRTVNLSKGNFRFAPIRFLESNLEIIEKMPESNFDSIIEKYVEMNVAHPFREGNGRATRIWLDLILKSNMSMCIDWAKIDKEEYLSAMERSPVNFLEIKVLLKGALTSKINDRQVYMRGIQRSYEYEGYYTE